MTRPVHYVAHGRGGLAFDCFYEELRHHIAAREEVEATFQGPAKTFDESRARRQVVAAVERRTPSPRRHTDLRKVTCLDCWREIVKLAPRMARGGAKS